MRLVSAAGPRQRNPSRKRRGRHGDSLHQCQVGSCTGRRIIAPPLFEGGGVNHRCQVGSCTERRIIAPPLFEKGGVNEGVVDLLVLQQHILLVQRCLGLLFIYSVIHLLHGCNQCCMVATDVALLQSLLRC